ncbi:MAG: C25 family cysteine peptidase [Planctomycetota bacterium]
MSPRFSGVTLFLLLLAGANAAQPNENVVLTVSSESAARTVLAFDIPDFERRTIAIDGVDRLAVSFEHTGFARMGEAGHPQVPALCPSILIPDAARMEARVIEAEYYEIENVLLAPHRGPIPRNVDPDTVPYTFGPVYQQDALFPASVVSLRDPYILHDVRGMVVEVYPLQYNPVTGTLRVHTRIAVEVAAAGRGRINTIDRRISPRRASRSFEALYGRHFCNYQGARGRFGLAVEASEDGEMLIISYGAFLAAMQPLVDWKDSIGIPTTMVDVASIGNNATSIKNYITSVYNTSNLSYVLLVGDHAQVVSSSYGGAVSDPTYSTLTADWYPDVLVGRFSAETVAHVDTQVQRTIEYEQAGHGVDLGGWNARGMGIGSAEGAGAGHYGEADWAHQDLIRGELLAAGFAAVDRIYDPGATATQVRNGLNDGRRCVHYTGHGYTYGWGTTGFSTTDIANLTNAGMLPFVHSVACLGGDFNGTTSFGEAWIRATRSGEPTGAIAAYCSSVNQYWAEPMYAQGNHTYGGRYGAAERFWDELNWSVGGCWYGGSCTMMDITGSGGRDMFMTWHLFGDPSVRLVSMSPLFLTLPDELPGRRNPGEAATATLRIEDGGESYVHGSGKVLYRFDGGTYLEIPLTDLGGDLYEMVLPHTVPGDAPEFYFSAEGDGGATVTLPPDAPGTVFSFAVCFADALFADDFEADRGWTVQSWFLSDGAWERGDPVGTAAQPEDDHSADGTQCFVTTLAGGASGDNDVDGGPTCLDSPPLALSGDDAEISWAMWFYHGDSGVQQPGQIHVSNDGGTTWTEVATVTHDPVWRDFSFRVSDYVAPAASVIVRFTAIDNPNDDVVEAAIDDFTVTRYDYDPSFWADAYSISVATGGAVDMHLAAGATKAGKPYLILGSLSGTVPGFDVLGMHVPLNWDSFTDMILAMVGSPYFVGFWGTLDGAGEATATLDTLGPLDASLIGLGASFAYGVLAPPDFVSNAFTVIFDP